MGHCLVRTFTAIVVLLGKSGPVTGGFFDLFAHLRVTQHAHNSTMCDVINPNIGIMYWEAIRYAIVTINRHDLLHGNIFTLVVLDTCDKGKIIPPYHTVTYQGFAVIGPYSSESAEFTAKFLSLFRITTISYAATATKLNDKNQYPFFFRTVPSDNSPAYIYHELSLRFNWRYVAVIFSDCIEGRSIKNALTNLQSDSNICIRLAQPVKHYDGDKQYLDVISAILRWDIRVVYLFLEMEDWEAFLRAAENFKGELGKLTLVLGSSCGTLVQIPIALRPFLNNNLITVGIDNPIPDDFAQHFESLTPRVVFNETSDFSMYFKAYFRDYWFLLYGCTCTPLDSSQPCCNQPNTKYNHLAPVRPVIDAVNAISNALRRALKAKCGNVTSCYFVNSREEIQELRASLNRFMLATDKNDKLLPRLTKDGETNSNYQVYQYWNSRETNGFVPIGQWNYTHFKLNGKGLNLSRGFVLPNSTCGVKCGHHDVIVYQDACPQVCWKCKLCEVHKVIKNNTCIECELGYRANVYRNACLELPIIEHISPTHALSVGIISFSSVCLLAALVILFIYVHNYDTPIIKATSFELSLFSLAGLILMFLTPIIIVSGPPSMFVCCLQKIMFGLSLTCCYAPLMLKTNRIYRIFMSSQKFKLKKLNLVSTPSLLLLIGGMIGVQLVMGIFWIMTDVPMTIIIYPENADYAFVQCNVTEVPGTLNVIFPITLMVASTFWAFKTRNLPEEFSEIKSIGVTMYITMFSGTCALAVIAILKQKSENMNYYIICFTYQLVAVVTLIGQYAMKVKILYWGVVLEETIPRADCPMTGFSAVVANPALSCSKTNLNLNFEDELKAFDLNLRRGTASSIASNMRLASPKLKRFSIDFTH